MAELLDNRLAITGDAATLDQFAAELDGGPETPVELAQILPIEKVSADGFAEHKERQQLWGTDALFDVQCSRPQPGMLVYEFESPWAPPRTALELLALRYDTLQFELVWVDWGSATIGRTVYRGWLDRSDETARSPDERLRLLRASGWAEMTESWLNETAPAVPLDAPDRSR